MKPNVWLKDGMLMTFGSAVDTQQHQHHAIQLVWSTASSECFCADTRLTGSVIIGSQVAHKLILEAGWVVLIEPACEVGRFLTNTLAGHDSIEIDHLLTDLDLPFDELEIPTASQLDNFFLILGLPNESGSFIVTCCDERIQSLIARLDLCFTGQCKKPASWRAQDIADDLALSESRFRHLFRQQMGIAWRPYLRWRRLACAIRAMIRGQSATDSAHSAGFSDSAHLSRTFRNMFGLSIQQAKQLFFRR